MFRVVKHDSCLFRPAESYVSDDETGEPLEFGEFQWGQAYDYVKYLNINRRTSRVIYTVEWWPFGKEEK